MIASMRNREIYLRNTASRPSGDSEGGIRPDDVARARAAVLGRDVYRDLATLFGALADPTRASIVHVLAHQELCTADLALTLGLHRPAASQHLRLLRQLRIVRARREGRLVLYSLDDAHIADLLGRGLEHLLEPETPAST
jgi:ArsR family transcriptional regulator, lead/cadmium/zinc/bismuth-responsive transcriptional repressor